MRPALADPVAVSSGRTMGGAASDDRGQQVRRLWRIWTVLSCSYMSSRRPAVGPRWAPKLAWVGAKWASRRGVGRPTAAAIESSALFRPAWRYAGWSRSSATVAAPIDAGPGLAPAWRVPSIAHASSWPVPAPRRRPRPASACPQGLPTVAVLHSLASARRAPCQSVADNPRRPPKLPGVMLNSPSSRDAGTTAPPRNPRQSVRIRPCGRTSSDLANEGDQAGAGSNR